jgi:hypothetical protein
MLRNLAIACLIAGLIFLLLGIHFMYTNHAAVR